MHIGVAGLGRMGSAIAKRLMEVGHQVTVWNRSPGKAGLHVAAGASEAATPAALAREVEAVVTILTDSAAINAVYDGAQGLLAGARPGTLFIEMSTVRPETEIALAARVTAGGSVFVECPVGGTVAPAQQGKLLGLAGGDAAAFARAKPILEQLCRRVEHIGPAGAGASMKLAINLPLALYWQGLGEALALVQHLGLDAERLMDIMADTSGASTAVKGRAGAVAKKLQGGDLGPASFDLDGIRKDLRTMVAEAAARGFDLPLAAQTLAVYDEASAAGWGAADAAEIPAFWAAKAKG
jgi:3-hydroxyisobutyrate dehydrogenase